MGFEIVSTNRDSACNRCGKLIPSGVLKLRYTRYLGSASVNKSLCLPCLGFLLRESGAPVLK